LSASFAQVHGVMTAGHARYAIGHPGPPILPAARRHEADGARVTGSRYIEPAHVV
jgi:hypothetical protein